MRYLKFIAIDQFRYRSQSAHMAYSGYRRPNIDPIHRIRSSKRFCRQDYLPGGRYTAHRIAY